MLSQKQQKCIFLMISTNMTQKEISKEIQISENSISEWKKDEEFKAEIQRQLKENFGALAIEAQKELNKLLKDKNSQVRIQAVKDILDRAGYKPTEKVEQSGESKLIISLEGETSQWAK